MILENVRDKKLLELYAMLTRSDFKGNMNDTFVVRMLYATMCIEIALNESRYNSKLQLNKNDILNCAKEVIRVYDEKLYDESDNYSIEVLACALIDYMYYEDIDYSKVHSQNGRELKINLMNYIYAHDE